MTVNVMDNLRQLLVAIAALTLLFSMVSGANPNYFAGYSAFAEDHEDEGEDNSGSSDDQEDHDDSDRHERDDKSDEQIIEATFGANSSVELGVDTEIEDGGDNAGSVEADLEVETEDQDLADGEHVVSLVCETPDFEKVFDSPLEVEGGDGKFSQELVLVNGTTYENCVVSIGDTDVALSTFRVVASADDADDEADDEEDESGRGDDDDKSQRGHDSRTGLETEGGKVELEVEVETNMTDGTYDAKFTCEEPAVDMTIEDGFVVQDGEGKLDAELDLADGTYSECKVESGDETIASFDSIAIKQEDDDDEEDSGDVEEKRKEKRKDIVTRITAHEEHKRRINASPASTGDFDPGWNYTLIANGTASPRTDIDSDTESVNASALTGEGDVDVNLDMGVWKSNRALVLLSVLNGTVVVDDKEYTVELGYALYSVSHDAMRIGAFVSDEDGNIYKLKLRGTATGEDAEFPGASGESIDLVFEGNSGAARNSISGWQLELEGTVKAE